MNKEDVAMIGFEIVAYSGEARSKLLNILKEVRVGEVKNIEKTLENVDELLKLAHESQTKMLSKEARGESIELGFIFIHGQDHLMTTLLLRDIILDMVELYKRVSD